MQMEITRPLSELDQKYRQRLVRDKVPAHRECMLATLSARKFDRPDWLYERKLDGVRILGFRDGDQVRLESRNQKDRSSTWPELVEALAGQTQDRFVVDGEIVAFEGSVTSFSKLQGRMQIRDEQAARESGIRVWLYIFDLLHLDGFDLRKLPLRARKSLLKRALDWREPLRFTVHINENGVSYWRDACEKGWEGVMAKDASSEYVGRRSDRWLKFKCVNQQEFVIGGYTDPEGSRQYFGALLIGYYEGEKLLYAGRVGTGFSDELLENLGRKLAARSRETSPFADDVNGRHVHFVRPTLVGEVGFTEWTEDGRLRHPRFLGIREDKPPKDVARERAQHAGT